jgi:HPt (histidine-containing phosphotransfer) domain-containing protein
MCVADESGGRPAAFDRAGLVERLGGDESLADELLREFVDDARGALERIAAALEGGDWAAAGREGHATGGVSANLGATAMKEAALALCGAARNGNARDAGAAMGRMKAALGALSAAVAGSSRTVTASAGRPGC